ncbi:MAG TPA: Smr/MutS family protein [Rhizomicrobium sp.]|nr:Smr/MutS family protein [Rhizomicrobium sp.]
MSPRSLSDEERALFEETFKDAKKPARKKIKSTALAPPKAKKPAVYKATPPPLPSRSAHTGGIDGRTAERMRRGILEPEARLDLHGMTEAAAHTALNAFLRNASARGHRLVIVVTGKGRNAQDPYAPFDLELNMRKRGVLKTIVPRWLKEPELAGLVVDVRTAHRRHGGAGALYVYLRKAKS